MNGLRQKAYSIGELFYTIDKPCKRGHNSKRYTSTGNCVACMELNAQAQATRNISLRIVRNSKLAKDERLYSRVVPFDFHNAFDQLRDIALYGTDDAKSSCKQFIEMMAALPKQIIDDQPKLVGVETLTASDLVRLFGYKDGKSTAWESFRYNTPNPGYPDSFVMINNNWYDFDSVFRALNGQLDTVSPGVPDVSTI